MARRRIIVVGAVAAGPAAAAEARRTDPDAEILLVERGPDMSYSACEMPIFLAGELTSDERLVRYTPERFRERYGVDVRMHTEVERIDPEKRHLFIHDLKTGTKESLWYDALVLATGVEAVVPDALNAASHQVHVLRRLEDARIIRRQMESRKPGHVVIIGSGYVGLDGVEAFSRVGWRCSLLASGGRLLGDALGEEATGWVRSALENDGVAVRAERATGLDIDPDGRVRAVRTDQGERIGCDMVLVATGTRPNIELAVQAGLKPGAAGGLKVDEGMQTSESAIWACGDIVDFTDLITGRAIHAPLALNAFRSGRVAGRNAARWGRGRPARMPSVVHAAAVSVAEHEVAHTGLSERSARAAGLDAVTASIRHRSASSNSPNHPLHVHLVAERGNRKLLGAQIVGREGAAQRVNTVTALIRMGATVDDMYEVDYLYTPRIAPAHDALFVAARQLQKAL